MTMIEHQDKDYFLFQFSDEELLDVLVKSDEWSETDVQLAAEILKKRGRKVEKGEIERLRTERMNQLRQADPLNSWWIVGGYLFSFFGGLIGLLIGYSIWQAKKTLPGGEKVFRYGEKDRKNAQIIFVISAITLSIGVLLRLLLQFD